MCDSTCEGTRVVSLVETESRIVVARAWGQVGMESYCSMGTEFQCGRIKTVLEMGGG